MCVRKCFSLSPFVKDRGFSLGQMHYEYNTTQPAIICIVSLNTFNLECVDEDVPPFVGFLF